MKVLLIDDDELILETLGELLTLLGYETESADSAEIAWQKLKDGLEPDYIILDMNLPGLGGEYLVPLLLKDHPAVSLLISTGRADKALEILDTYPQVKLLAKPYTVDELRAQLEGFGKHPPQGHS